MKIMAYSIEQFPTPEQLENTTVYEKLVSAHRCLAELKGKTLTAADIEHYQKIILALTRTAELMQQTNEAA